MPDRIRVAFVDHTAVLSGGEVALANLIATIDKQRWESLTVLGGRGALIERLEAEYHPVELLPFPPSLATIRQGALRTALFFPPGPPLPGRRTPHAECGRSARSRVEQRAPEAVRRPGSRLVSHRPVRWRPNRDPCPRRAPAAAKVGWRVAHRRAVYRRRRMAE